jgi:UDP-glucose 4-epimerase
MVIPRLVGQALMGEPLTVYGDGRQTRCFLHVRDAVEAILALSNCPEAVGEVVNIGSTEEIAILDLAKKILEIVGEQESSPVNTSRQFNYSNTDENRIRLVPYEKAYGRDFDDLLRRVPDITKITHLTGWSPRYNLKQALIDVIDYCRSCDMESRSLLR